MTQPLPSIDDVCDIVLRSQRARDPVADDYYRSLQAAQAIDALYRKHLIEWLRGDEAWMAILHGCGFTQSMSKNAARVLAEAVESENV